MSDVEEKAWRMLKEFREFAMKATWSTSRPPPKPTRQEELLSEIRDLLKRT